MKADEFLRTETAAFFAEHGTVALVLFERKRSGFISGDGIAVPEERLHLHSVAFEIWSSPDALILLEPPHDNGVGRLPKLSLSVEVEALSHDRSRPSASRELLTGGAVSYFVPQQSPRAGSSALSTHLAVHDAEHAWWRGDGIAFARDESVDRLQPNAERAAILVDEESTDTHHSSCRDARI